MNEICIAYISGDHTANNTNQVVKFAEYLHQKLFFKRNCELTFIRTKWRTILLESLIEMDAGLV